MSVNTTGDDLKIWYIKHYDFFSGLDSKIKPYVKERTSMCTYQQGETIYIGSDESIYLLKEGNVKISRLSSKGEEMIQDLLHPGEIFGTLPLIENNQETHTEFARAATNTTVCIIYRKDFEQLIRMHPKLNQKLTRWYGIRMRRFEQRMNDLIFKDVKKRLAGFLIHYAVDFGKEKNGEYEVKALLTHEEIGMLVGAARQTVTTMLNEMREENLMEFDRKRWTFKNLNALKVLAE